MTEQKALEVLEALLTYDLSVDEEIAVDMGIKALEKQIAKKPLVEDERAFFRFHHCAECKQILAIEFNYCENCGQKIDWGNEDAE